VSRQRHTDDARLPPGTRKWIDAACDRFEAAWDRGPPRIDDFLDLPNAQRRAADRRALLAELVLVDLERRWQRAGREGPGSGAVLDQTTPSDSAFPARPLLEDYLARCAELGRPEEIPVEWIAEEYRVRHLWGDRPGHDDYCRRFAGRAGVAEVLREADEQLALRPDTVASTLESTAGDPAASISAAEFSQGLIDSGLMTADELATFRRSQPDDGDAEDASGLVGRLIEADKLTEYQAAAVARGEARELVLGEYVILDRLGAGGMGVVLKALHRRLDRLAALKVLPKDSLGSPKAVARFQHEVRAAAKLIHPNVVITYDAGEQHGTHYLAMEYVEGRDLGRVVAEEGPLPVGRAVGAVVQAARGLDYAHGQGIVHRDVKPQNLMLDAQGRVKVLDLGLARLRAEGPTLPAAEQSTELTTSGEIMGTFNCMAPEQAEDPRAADGRADVYALGCTLFWLLTGRYPYRADTVVRKLLAHREDPIPSLRETRDDVPEALDAACRRMMAKKPEERQQSMGEVIEELEASIAPVEEGRSGDSALDAFLHDVAVEGSGVRLSRGWARNWIAGGGRHGGKGRLGLRERSTVGSSRTTGKVCAATWALMGCRRSGTGRGAAHRVGGNANPTR